jgi:hypothetical protein
MEREVIRQRRNWVNGSKKESKELCFGRGIHPKHTKYMKYMK